MKNLSLIFISVCLLGASLAFGSDSLKNEGGGTSGGGMDGVDCVYLASHQASSEVEFYYALREVCGASDEGARCLVSQGSSLSEAIRQCGLF